MMTIRGTVETPDSVDLTLKITMSLGEWKRLQQLFETGRVGHVYPAWKLNEAINKALLALTNRVEMT